MSLRILSLAGLLLVANAALAAGTAPANGPSATLPAPAMDDEVSNPCQQWGRIARGILMEKKNGHPKRKGQMKLEQQLLDLIYDHDTSGMTLEGAYALGYKTCLPALKNGVR